jgi:DNA topoisomerase-1
LKKSLRTQEYYASDWRDREGEAISWHLCHALDLDPKETKRIVFHESPSRQLCSKKSQDWHQSCECLQALTGGSFGGYELSPILCGVKFWSKLSAGRVQSVAVRLIVERERRSMFSALFLL